MDKPAPKNFPKSAAVALAFLALVLIQSLGYVTKIAGRLAGRQGVTRLADNGGDTPKKGGRKA